MKKTTVAAIVIVFVGLIGIMIWKYAKPEPPAKDPWSASDAGNITESVRIGGDNYLGYWFLVSPEMRRQSAAQGIGIQFADDQGNYAERLEKFSRGEYEAIVLPVNSYLEHGAKHSYPGVAIASISESKGADGIVVFEDQFKDASVNALNNAALKFVYTAASPSEFLLDLTVADFDLDQLKAANTWQVGVGGSEEVLQKVKNREGDVFVLWEPDLSKALETPGTKYLWGSDKFSGYIVDVFVFRREFLEKKQNVALALLRTYFRVLDVYANNRDRMLSEMSDATGLNQSMVEKMLAKIDWFDLEENASLQFGLPTSVSGTASDGVINTIVACTKVMLRTGKLGNDPLQGNPYLITNSSLLRELLNTQAAMPIGQNPGGQKLDFAQLSVEEWKKLRVVGTMRVEPITFQTSNNALSEDGMNRVDEIAVMLINNYPQYRILVRGHTAPGSDEQANLQLSLERAQAVAQRLTSAHNIDPDRFLAEGVGSKLPSPRKSGESQRQYQYRLPRVEFILVEANPL